MLGDCRWWGLCFARQEFSPVHVGRPPPPPNKSWRYSVTSSGLYGWVTEAPIVNKAVLLRLDEDTSAGTAALRFVTIVDLPGGSCKFTVRYDAVSRKYLSLTNNVLTGQPAYLTVNGIPK